MVTLSADDLRVVTAFAAAPAEDVLEIFETVHPGDRRPREAVEAARAFVDGGRRGKVLRDTAWAALAAAREASTPAAGNAARAAMAAAGAAYLHPLADPHQVKHILGAAAHAALATGDDPTEHLERARRRATPHLVDVLSRYPAAPPGGGRVGELIRQLDRALR